MLWLPGGKKFDDTATHFDRNHECDGQTDRHKDAHRMTAQAALAYRRAAKTNNYLLERVTYVYTLQHGSVLMSFVLSSRQSLVRWCLSEWTKSFHADLVASSWSLSTLSMNQILLTCCRATVVSQ